MSDRSATVVCDDDSPPQLKSGKVNPCFEIRAAAISAVSSPRTNRTKALQISRQQPYRSIK